MLAHHTVGGCPMQVGDLIGSGTISGTDPGSVGSFLEASAGGNQASEIVREGSYLPAKCSVFHS